ncbi:DUF2007 domain-containing protein [Chloroflexota bacterium]
MMARQPNFVVVCTVQGELQASVIKSHLESEGIPVLLKYESAGKVFGLTINGLGEVKIQVPKEFADEARRIIEPGEIERDAE